MQFKHPEILYALFLLLLPIIVHLFQLRRFEKVAFTNVEFLKKIELQTRKSSKLKKFLVLLSRLFLFAALIFAFAQPYFSKIKKNKEQHTYIYLDNSFSMQAKGKKGALLKRAAQDLIETAPTTSNINLLTNDNEWYNLTPQEFKNTLLSLDYHPIKQDLKSILLKIKNKTKINKNSLNKISLISDFQNINGFKKIKIDSSLSYDFIQLKPVKQTNISLDSVYISNQNSETIILTIIAKNHSNNVENVPISLYNENILLGKSTVDIPKNTTANVEFSVPFMNTINGRITTADLNLTFDNDLYFSINKTDKINVLVIGNDNTFLSKIYTNDEFNLTNSKLNELDYSILDNQNLIVLNEIEVISNPLISSLSNAIDNQVHLVIIPNVNSDLNTYNNLLRTINLGNISSKNENKLNITDINFSHPFFKNVFERQIKNFQYPSAKNSYISNLKNASSLLKFENETAFVSQSKIKNSSLSWLASAINTDNSNFKNSPLIVPLFYNFGKYSYKNSQLNYVIGNSNEIEIKAALQKDDILQISNQEQSFIPMQQVGNTTVKITTDTAPLKSGFYTIKNKEQELKNIAFNYNRSESVLQYDEIQTVIQNSTNVKYHTNVKEAFNAINNEYKTSSFWQLFLIIALISLIVEILLLKFMKP